MLNTIFLDMTPKIIDIRLQCHLPEANELREHPDAYIEEYDMSMA